MDILLHSAFVFLSQLIFICCRTWNVKAIADNKISQVLLSGCIIHIAWLISIALGSFSVYKIVGDFQMKYIPVVFFSMSGGLLGSWLAMKFKKKGE